MSEYLQKNLDKEKVNTWLAGIPKSLFVFITGASGCGKTTITKSIEQHLPRDIATIYYFDDCGVPDTEQMIQQYGSGEKWQQAKTYEWIERLFHQEGRKILILEGSFNPEFAIQKMQELRSPNYILICLHAERSIREKRLIEERKQPELANQDMENYANVLKDKTLKNGGRVFDSSTQSVSEVAHEIISHLMNISMQ